MDNRTTTKVELTTTVILYLSLNFKRIMKLEKKRRNERCRHETIDHITKKKDRRDE